MKKRLVVLIAVLLWPSALIAGPLITSFSPTQAPAGTVLDILGSGFTGTSDVHFHPDNDNRRTPWNVVSDSHLQVLVLPQEPNSPAEQAIIVQVGSAATVTLGDSFVQVTNTVNATGGTHFFWVRSGGTLNYTGGSGVVYVESGGVWNSPQFGGDLIALVESGGTFTTNGGHIIYYETGANITAADHAERIPLTDLQPSPVSSNFFYGPIVPEPTTWSLACVAAASTFAYRGRKGTQHR
jgi:hypothetical protein